MTPVAAHLAAGIEGPGGTRRLAERLASALIAGDVVCLYGQMGAGKTTFARCLASSLGYAGEVVSPTFKLMNVYAGDLTVYHFDLYRIGSADELTSIGLDEYLNGGEGADAGICLVEWPEVAEAYLPAARVVVGIGAAGRPDHRVVRISSGDAGAASRLAEAGL